MRKDLTPYYRALGLNPGAEAVEIRAAYRQMVQQWHPDLFKAGSPMQVTAEDITKEINEAYDQLYRKKLYKNFSPKSERKNAAPSKPRSSADAGAQKAEPSEKAKGTRQKKASQPRPVRKNRADWWKNVRSRRWARRTTVLMAICAFLLCIRFCVKWIENLPRSSSEGVTLSAPQPRGTVLPPAAEHAASTATNKPSLKVVKPLAAAPAFVRGDAGTEYRAKTLTEETGLYPGVNPPGMGALRPIDRASTLLDVIEVGDTKAKVLSLQGTPDEVGESVVRYGSSLFYFRNGIVTGWLDRYPRLHVRDRADVSLPSIDTFAIGASMGDVVRAQGQPAAFSASSYSYGTSVVFFDSGHVTGWNEGDVSLRSFEIPTLDFFELDRVTANGGFSGL